MHSAPRGSTHVLENDVDAAAVGDALHFVGNLLLVMVDGVVGTKFASLRQFAVVAGSGDDHGAEHFADLDGCGAHTRAAAHNENRLARAKLRVAHQHVPRREEHQWHGGGLHKTERVGNGKYTRARNGNQLAVSAFGIVPEHGELRTEILASAVALLAVATIKHGREQDTSTYFEVGDVLATIGDFTCDIAAEYVRQLYPGKPFAHPEIEMVECAGANANEDMIFAQLGIGRVFVLQDFWTTKLVNANSFHAQTPKYRDAGPARETHDSTVSYSGPARKLHGRFLG